MSESFVDATAPLSSSPPSSTAVSTSMPLLESMNADLFPNLTHSDILSFQFSAWYPTFASLSIKSTVIRPLSEDFRRYLDVDGVVLPRGSEDVPAESTIEDLSDSDSDEDEEDEEVGEEFAFPELDEKIREAVREYGAVFPKLNFSSPRDASWLLPSSSPLKCTSPADVYMLLKSSDFVTHDLSEEIVFAGCVATASTSGTSTLPKYELELVLRKWYAVDRSREMRCFVREGVLLGISQRDTNYYDFMNDPATQRKIVSSVQNYWERNIKEKWTGIDSYVFDVLLTRDLSRFHILDFNPYAPRTDSLLFTYEDLSTLSASAPATSASLHLTTTSSPNTDVLPELRVIDSKSHPAATRNAPANQHNMVPFDALSFSSGRGAEDFQKIWEEEVRKGMQGDEDG